jgi:hypothetical protein
LLNIIRATLDERGTKGKGEEKRGPEVHQDDGRGVKKN